MTKYTEGQAKYTARHRLQVNLHGKAKNRLCAHCGNRAAEWSTIHGTLDEYLALCVPCHRSYDETNVGYPQKLDSEDIELILELLDLDCTQKEVADAAGISPSMISRIRNGSRWRKK